MAITTTTFINQDTVNGNPLTLNGNQCTIKYVVDIDDDTGLHTNVDLCCYWKENLLSTNTSYLNNLSFGGWNVKNTQLKQNTFFLETRDDSIDTTQDEDANLIKSVPYYDRGQGQEKYTEYAMIMTGANALHTIANPMLLNGCIKEYLKRLIKIPTGPMRIIISGGMPVIEVFQPVTFSMSYTANAGEVMVTVIDGIAPFEYSSDGTTWQSSNVLTGTPAQVSVRDAEGTVTLRTDMEHVDPYVA